ncbi:DUF1311 domain-containing protein [Desulfobulbus rhabdoformis]|uniref:lysozyme inhibitor LprI family protein n=1 Tax=Desulfobulbus rhabdoformis TaxID=34032 RepID=UPI001963D03A|nr:lysozyme inhibitor LprI family protein [Desulfobulbus rhabdoformis]MBM9615498.1 DUF1311 domain-containing protein [Desulfobulbus rhabdoformis]
MCIKRCALLLTLLFAVSHGAQATGLGLSQEYSRCMEKAGGVTVDMLNCIAQETKLQDQRLNRAYKRVMQEQSEGQKQALKNAQRAWIRYRDANCQFYADPDGGSLAGVMASDCLLQTTASRALELEQMRNE